MTAGVGWIGEINNQFNITKGYHVRGVTNENIPPNITFGPPSVQRHTHTCWGTSGSWFQSINRKLGIALVNNWLWTKGRNTFNIGWEYPSRLPGRQRRTDRRRSLQLQPTHHFGAESE